MKKVLLISQEFPPDCGGAGVVAINNACYMTKEGIDVCIMTSADYNIKEEGFKIIKIKRIPKIFPIMYGISLRQIDLNVYDKIILNDIGACFVATFFLSKKIQKKCIVYLHGNEVQKILNNSMKLANIIGFRKKYIKLLKNADKIIAVSHYMKKIFCKAIEDKNIVNKVNVIQNSINSNWYFPDKIDLYEKHGIDRENEIFFSASRIIKEKGYDVQYSIIKKILLDGEKVHWIIAGEGGYASELKDMIERDKLDKSITFVGKLDKNEMRQYYSSSDLFWLLSRRKEEAFGLVYLEAAACGIPVIANDIAGVREAVANGITGILVKSEEECIIALKEKKYKTLNRENCINFVNKVVEGQNKLLEYL